MKKERKAQNFIKKPYYEGGMTAMKVFIKQHLSYPKEAADKKIEGTVHVRYTINYKGKVIDTKIVSGIGHGCDQEASRLVQLLVFNVPRNRNLKAVFHKTLQIHFRLPKVVPPVKIPEPAQTQPTIHYNYTTTKKKEEKASPKKETPRKSHQIIIKY